MPKTIVLPAPEGIYGPITMFIWIHARQLLQCEGRKISYRHIDASLTSITGTWEQEHGPQDQI